MGAATSSHLTLTWTDASGNEDGFRIERKQGAGSFAHLVNAAANATSYINTGLSAETTYTYRVRAYKGNVVSAWTAEVSETTTAASGNQIGNGSFEAWLAGWTTTQATLTRVAGGQHGNWAARVETNCACSSAKLEDSPHTVDNPAQGDWS